MLNPSRIASRAAAACAVALALLAPVHATPVLQMSTATTAAALDLTVQAQDVVDIYAYQFTLNFDPTLLMALSGTEGTLLSGGGSTFFSPGDIDNVAGSITFVLDTLIGPVSGVDGSGDLATFSFSILQAGLASFTLSDVFLLDSAGNVIAADVGDLVAAVPEPGSLWLAAMAFVALALGRQTTTVRTARGQLRRSDQSVVVA